MRLSQIIRNNKHNWIQILPRRQEHGKIYRCGNHIITFAMSEFRYLLLLKDLYTLY